MINLHLAIYDGDVMQIPFENQSDLIDYIYELKRFDCIWIVTSDGADGEIIITENIETIVKCIKIGFFELKDIHIQEYQSYEDAYSVALDMREPNKRCYND